MKAATAQPFFWNVRVYYQDTDLRGVRRGRNAFPENPS
jgi:acyl-CoA thioesterase FadM